MLEFSLARGVPLVTGIGLALSAMAAAAGEVEADLSGESLMSVGRVGPAEVRRLGPAHRKRAPISASCCPVRASEVRYRPASGVPEEGVPLEDVAATPPIREAGC